MDTQVAFDMSSVAVTEIAERAQDALKRKGKDSKIIWYGEPPPLPHTENGFVLDLLKDEDTLPGWVRRRLRILRENNIPIKYVLIAHELPKETPKPTKAPEKQEKPKVVSDDDYSIFWKSLALTLGIPLGIWLIPHILPYLIDILAQLLLAAFLLLGLGMGAIAFLGGLFCTTSDPILICVLNDQGLSWCELGRWDEPIK